MTQKYLFTAILQNFFPEKLIYDYTQLLMNVNTCLLKYVFTAKKYIRFFGGEKLIFQFTAILISVFTVFLIV